MMRPFMRLFVSSIRGRCFGYEIQEIDTAQSKTRKSDSDIPFSPCQGSSVNKIGSQKLKNAHFPVGRDGYGVDSEIGLEERPVGILVRKEFNIRS